jgi:hypothetical protein
MGKSGIAQIVVANRVMMSEVDQSMMRVVIQLQGVAASLYIPKDTLDFTPLNTRA